jgi:tRNA-specific 2-thiouridylase
VCEKVGIPFYAINFKEEFWKEVVEVFASEYFKGRTPSPCILCNEKLKFSTLFQKALEIGATKVCTGHYARIQFNEESGRYELMRALDLHKDQSYFLFGMTQDQLSKTLFPLGSYTKPYVRQLAEKGGLVTAQKPESQDICFIPDGNYSAFLERHFPQLAKQTQGKIRHVNGTILGEHKGIHSVTVGQRKGLNVAFGKPLYVEKIDPTTNEVTVGEKESVQKREMVVERINWILCEPSIGDTYRLTCKIRSRSPESECLVTVVDKNRAEVLFYDPQLAITPGQAAVFYHGEKVFGGGWIA